MRKPICCIVVVLTCLIAVGLSGCGIGSSGGSGSSQGESNLDGDADGVQNSADNCPDIANADQTDTDGDAVGDACDDDDDNDGIADDLDLASLDPQMCADDDGDGCDDCSVGSDGFGPLADNDMFNDGDDLDGDGLCDAGDGDPTNGLPLVHYKFNADDGGTIIDHGLARVDAAMVGTVTPTTDEGDRPVEAFDVSGAGNAIVVDETGLTRLNALLDDEMTIVMTCRTGSFGGNSGPLLEVSGSGSAQILVDRLARVINLSMDLDGDAEAAQTTSFRMLSGWYQMAITYSRHTTKLYINGNAFGLGYAEESAIFDFTKIALLGGDADLAISDFRVYDRSLKHRDVKALWNQLHAAFPMNRNSDGTGTESDPDIGVVGRYNGTVRGMNGTEFVWARFAMAPYAEQAAAMDFNGGNYLELDQEISAGLDVDTFSIAAWIKPEDTGTTGVIAAKEGWQLRQEGSSLIFGVNFDGGEVACEYPNFDTDPWYGVHGGWFHVVATWSRYAGTVNLYVNGDRVDTAWSNEPVITGDDPILIGAQYDAEDQAVNFWRGIVDDIRFFNKAIGLELITHPDQSEFPGVKQLFEDGYLVRGYTDCAYPYDDCNPAADRVLWQYMYMYEDPEPADPANPPPAERGSFTTGDTDDYDYLLDATGSHIQGSQWFLPPRDRWFIYSRSTHNDLDRSPSADGPQDRILGLLDWNSKSVDQFEYVFNPSGLVLDPDPDGELDHGGGIQAIGKYLAVPVDSNTGSDATSTVYSVLYNIDDFLNIDQTPVVRNPDIVQPEAHQLLGIVEKGGTYAADVLAAIVKDDTGRYLWTDGLYESSLESETDRYRFNISRKVEGVAIEDDSLAYKPEFVKVGEIDIDEADSCSHQDDPSVRCDNGNWNTGTLIAQTDGRIYLLLTGAFNQINLLEVRINKIQSSVSMKQPWERVHLNMPAFSNLTLKAGAGGRITRDGNLSLFTTSLSDGMDNDYVNWGRWDTFWEY